MSRRDAWKRSEDGDMDVKQEMSTTEDVVILPAPE